MNNMVIVRNYMFISALFNCRLVVYQYFINVINVIITYL